MSKDTKNTVKTGESPLSTNLSKSLASFSEIRDSAFKNRQALAMMSNENNNSKNFRKTSRGNASTTLIGLKKLQGLQGFTANKKNISV